MLLKPSFKITIGSETYDPGSQSPVELIIVNHSIDIPASSFLVKFGINDTTSKIKQGEDVEIQIGYEDDLKDVFSGIVDNIVPEMTRINVKGLNHATKLLEQRMNQIYESVSAGDIVQDLANSGGISPDTCSSGLDFPVYVIDDRKNTWDHIKELALNCGFDAYLTHENKLVFKNYEKDTTHTVEYGINIIEIEAREDRPMIEGVSVLGESPSSFKGADTSHWVTKKAVEGVEGEKSNLLVESAVIRDKDTAAKMAKALMDTYARTLSGTVKIIGVADIRLNDTVEVKSVPNEMFNGEFQIRSVEHVMSKTRGYTTTLGWRK